MNIIIMMMMMITMIWVSIYKHISGFGCYRLLLSLSLCVCVFFLLGLIAFDLRSHITQLIYNLGSCKKSYEFNILGAQKCSKIVLQNAN